MVYAHVIYKKTGLERKNVTPKAYNLLKNQYTLLGYVDENGDPVDGPAEQVKATKTQKKSAAPAVNEPRNEPRKQMSPEEIEAKKAELRALNEVAIQKAKDEQAAKEAAKSQSINTTGTITEVKQRQKPGPKPKQHA